MIDSVKAWLIGGAAGVVALLTAWLAGKKSRDPEVKNAEKKAEVAEKVITGVVNAVKKTKKIDAVVARTDSDDARKQLLDRYSRD